MRSIARGTDTIANGVSAALASFRLGLAQAFAAWPVLMGRALFYLVAMAMISALWDKVAAARLAHTLATALPPGGLAPYVGATEWITLSVAAIHLRLEDDIRSGALEPHLLRPKPYLVQKVAEQMGATAARLAAIGLAALAFFLFRDEVPRLDALFYVVILGVPAAFLGVLLFTLVGLSAFWIRRVLPPFMIVQKLLFLLGGLMAPISLYPVWLYRFALATPFVGALYFAGDQIIAPSLQRFAAALAVELAWLAIITALIALVWRAGLKRVLREGL